MAVGLSPGEDIMPCWMGWKLEQGKCGETSQGSR